MKRSKLEKSYIDLLARCLETVSPYAEQQPWYRVIVARRRDKTPMFRFMENEPEQEIKKPFLPMKSLTERTGEIERLITDECLIEKNAFTECNFSPDTIAEEPEFKQNHFEKCALDKLRVSHAWLRNNKFDNCSIANTSFKQSRLERVEFNMSKLVGISFEGCSGTDISFIGCNCQFSDFRETKFKAIYFCDCILREADFQGADLRGVIFNNCDLREAQFSFARLAGADFRSSRIEGIRVAPDNLRGAIMEYHQAAYLGAKLLKLDIR